MTLILTDKMNKKIGVNLLNPYHPWSILGGTIFQSEIRLNGKFKLCDKYFFKT